MPTPAGWHLFASPSVYSRRIGDRASRTELEDLGRALLLDEQRGDRRSIALRHRRIGQAYAHPEIADFPEPPGTCAKPRPDGGPGGRIRPRPNDHLPCEVHVAPQQPDAALFTLHRIGNTLASCGSSRYRGHANTVMGRAHTQLGNVVEADRCYSNALGLFTDAGPGAATDRETVLRLREELGEMTAQVAYGHFHCGKANTEGITSE
ncbi:hypothetical protein ALI144C_52670 [Actinosynnema sp. ALI-1.44]|uniref:hypothetical protein n=1 Tax=Actinosynnema sp. ALI-1.44 TaxID=1933779 RepID=UPI00097BC0DA|nr:hypothetical protein [Actinosynnema sp. ALI-1.44]ONI71178.1 hypothetical protein ALI144C_52670 [Actinosynnema sp. ALI-1.44]